MNVPTIGILTALDHEFVAMKAMINSPRDHDIPGGDVRYVLGEVPGSDGHAHEVVLALGDMGESLTAIHATQMHGHFPNLQALLMVGIAGGVPNPQKPEDHVRLGDVVISDKYGVVQFDFIKHSTDSVIYRSAPRPPSAKLLKYARHLRTREMEGERPWEAFTHQGLQVLNWSRPPVSMDILGEAANPQKLVGHPKDQARREGEPRVFLGLIASSNTLLKDPAKRDELRKQFGAKAVEMETAGLADAAYLKEIGYLGIRGICDYCDANKNDAWHKYAAMAAAGYVRAFLESIPATSSAISASITVTHDSTGAMEVPPNAKKPEVSPPHAFSNDPLETKNSSTAEGDRDDKTRPVISDPSREVLRRYSASWKLLLGGGVGLLVSILMFWVIQSQLVKWSGLSGGKKSAGIKDSLTPIEPTQDESKNLHVWKDRSHVLNDHGYLHNFENASLDKIQGIAVHSGTNFAGARMLVPQGVDFDVAWTGGLTTSADGEIHSVLPQSRMAEIRSVESKITAEWACTVSPKELPSSGVQYGPGLRLTFRDTMIADSKKIYQGPKLTQVEWRLISYTDRKGIVEQLFVKLNTGAPDEQYAAALAIFCQGSRIEDIATRHYFADKLFEFLKNGSDKSFMHLVAISAATLDPSTSVSRFTQMAAHHASEFRQADAAMAIALLEPVTMGLVAGFKEVLSNARTRARSVLLNELSNHTRIINFSNEDAGHKLNQLMRLTLQDDLDEGCRASAAMVMKGIARSTGSGLSEGDVRALGQALKRNDITVFERNMLDHVINTNKQR